MDSNAELKNQLHKLVVETEDTDILEHVKEVFTSLKGDSDWWDKTSNSQKSLIEKGVQQLDNGKGIPHDEVMENIAKKLNQK